MANPGLLLKTARMLSKTPAGKKAKKKVLDTTQMIITKGKKRFVPSTYKKGGKGPGASIRTTKPAEVTQSFGQAQRSINNMFGNDKLSKSVLKNVTRPMK